MRYRVEYETSDRPADLPAGATVTELSTLPVSIRTDHDRMVLIEKSVASSTSAYVEVRGTDDGKWLGLTLDQEHARTAARALLEAIGDPTPVDPSNPQLIKDGEGDYWMRQGSGYVMCNMDGDRVIDSTVTSLTSIARDYEGYTIVR